jgi:hypothetical protein
MGGSLFRCDGGKAGLNMQVEWSFETIYGLFVRGCNAFFDDVHFVFPLKARTGDDKVRLGAVEKPACFLRRPSRQIPSCAR